VVPVAAAVIADVMIVLAVAVAMGRRIVLATFVASVGIALIFAPQHPRSRLLLALAAIFVCAIAGTAYNELCLASVNDRLARATQQAIDNVRAWSRADSVTALLGTPILRLLRVAGAAIAVAASAVSALAVGDHIGTDEASAQTVFFVVADRSCVPNQVVIEFANGDSERTVRVAERSPNGRSWRLQPGIFSVSETEPVVQAHIGPLHASSVIDVPLRATPALPAVCGGH
jgi:hypothetical protein